MSERLMDALHRIASCADAALTSQLAPAKLRHAERTALAEIRREALSALRRPVDEEEIYRRLSTSLSASELRRELSDTARLRIAARAIAKLYDQEVDL